MLVGPTGNDFDLALRDWRALYVNCAARHNALINEMNKRRELTK